MKPLSKQELLLGWFVDKHAPTEMGEVESTEVLADGSARVTIRFPKEYIEQEPWRTTYEEQLANFFAYKKRVTQGEKASRIAREVGLTKQRLFAFLKAGPPYPRGHPGMARICTQCSRAAAKMSLCPIHYAQVLGLDVDVFPKSDDEETSE